MARLRDVPIVLGRVGLWGFLKRVNQELSEDSIFTWAAACAYSWLFALFPFFIFLLTLVPYLPEKTKGDVRHEIQEAVFSLPQGAKETVWNNVEPHLQDILHKARGGLLTVNLVLCLWAASGGMNMTMASLDRCFDVKRSRPYVLQRLMAVTMTVVVTLLVLVIMVLLPVGTLISLWIQNWHLLPDWTLWLFNLARLVLAMIFMVTMVAIIYHWGPNIKNRFRPLSPGAVFSVGIWLALGTIFREYIARWGNSSYSKTYGAMGGVVILLLFLYLDAVVLLIGAEINSEIDIVLAQESSPDAKEPAANRA